MLLLVLSPSANNNVASPTTYDASITCAMDLEYLFPIESETVSQPETMTRSAPITKCTEKSEQVPNGRQSTRACPTAECSQQSKPVSNVRQSMTHVGNSNWYCIT
jgi:hypothetical protein